MIACTVEYAGSRGIVGAGCPNEMRGAPYMTSGRELPEAGPGLPRHPSTGRYCIHMQQQICSLAGRPPMATGSETAEAFDERALLARVQAGESGAFDLLVQRYLPKARLVARRLMQNPDDADDLVQEAFLRALERIATFDISRAFDPWFTRLLINLGTDWQRKQTVRRTEFHDPEIFPGGSRPDRETERSELRSSLQRAMGQLPDRQRLIVTLFEIDGHSTEEVAEMLHISQVTVRWHLHQARKALRETLKGWME
jgi:RNA polymerase sigma-70 factor (ECF subfamily)